MVGSRWIFAAAGAAAGLSAITGSAHAAVDTQPVQKPFGVRIGYLLTSVNSTLFPEESDFRRSFSLKPFNVGVSYDISKSKTASPVVYGVYADYFAERSNDQNFTLEGNTTEKATSKVSAFGIGGSARFLFGTANAAWVPYAGVGIGIYSVRAKLDDVETTTDVQVEASSLSRQTTTTNTFSKSKTQVSVGGKVLVGVQGKSGLLGELEYDILPTATVKDSGEKLLDGKLSGLNIRVGYRF